MPELTISYKIDDDELSPEDVKNSYEISGGISVKYGNAILTKTNIEGDDGYVGNYLYHEVYGLITGIIKLIGGEKQICEIEEEFKGLMMNPINGQIFFAVIPLHLRKEIASERMKLYPCGPDGCPIPAKQFFNSVVKMGHDFLSDITVRYTNLNPVDIHSFSQALKDTEEVVGEYNKAH